MAKFDVGEALCDLVSKTVKSVADIGSVCSAVRESPRIGHAEDKPEEPPTIDKTSLPKSLLSFTPAFQNGNEYSTRRSANRIPLDTDQKPAAVHIIVDPDPSALTIEEATLSPIAESMSDWRSADDSEKFRLSLPKNEDSNENTAELQEPPASLALVPISKTTAVIPEAETMQPGVVEIDLGDSVNKQLQSPECEQKPSESALQAADAERNKTDSVENADTAGDDEDGFKRMWVRTSRAMFVVTMLGVLACIGVASYHLAEVRAEKYILAWSVGAFFVCIAVPVSLHAIHFNILHYKHPLQRHYIRILWMIPIYSIESWLALRFNSQRFILETLRESYEALVIYSFFSMLRECLGTNPSEQVAKLETLRTAEKPKAKHPVMFCLCFAYCMPSWEYGQQFLQYTSLGVLQYVPVQLFFAVATLVLSSVRTNEECYLVPSRRGLQALVSTDLRRDDVAVINTTLLGNSTGYTEWICPNYYAEGEYRWDRLYIYQLVLLNISQMWALYCMFFFFHEAMPLIKPLRPLTKVASVKGVVFFTFWQSCIIKGAVSKNWITGYHLLSYNAKEVADGLQNFLICIEMAVASLLMYYAYTYRDMRNPALLKALGMEEGAAAGLSVATALKDMLPTDIVKETVSQSKMIAKAAKSTAKSTTTYKV